MNVRVGLLHLVHALRFKCCALHGWIFYSKLRVKLGRTVLLHGRALFLRSVLCVASLVNSKNKCEMITEQNPLIIIKNKSSQSAIAHRKTRSFGYLDEV